jgi:hypothetical protein
MDSLLVRQSGHREFVRGVLSAKKMCCDVSHSGHKSKPKRQIHNYWLFIETNSIWRGTCCMLG